MEPKRTDLLNHLASKYGLKRYLEIGVQNPIQNFDQIICEYKVSVDPDPNAHATFCMTSDEFFKNVPEKIEREKLDVTSISDLTPQYIKGSAIPFDLIFIDGLHTAEQVKKDFENALKALSPNGFIVLHDCNPLKEEHTIVPRPTPTGHWNGDVYKFASCLDMIGICCTVDIDNGCKVVQPTFLNKPTYREFRGWDHFNENRKELLNLISWDDFINPVE